MGYILRRVEIRPRWDWKVYLRELKTVDEIWLKSDQGGIESFNTVAKWTVICSSWNQTKVGLKAENADDGFVYYYGLKSDQGGIERNLDELVESRRLLLVEIRPRWDWKVSNANVTVDSTSKLKSDQGGIERVLLSLFLL